MKGSVLIFALAAAALPLLHAKSTASNDPEVDVSPGDCSDCVEELTGAVRSCGEDVSYECVVNALAAASECVACICEVLDEAVGGADECDGQAPPPTEATGSENNPIARDCLICNAEVVTAVEECAQAGEGNIHCVELSMAATSDCLVCVCDVVATVGGIDTDECGTGSDNSLSSLAAATTAKTYVGQAARLAGMAAAVTYQRQRVLMG